MGGGGHAGRLTGIMSENQDVAPSGAKTGATSSTLSDLIRRSLGAGSESAQDLAPLLDGFGEATVAVYAERPLQISWEDLLLRESAFSGTKHSTLIVDPVLDFDALLPAGRPLEGIREIARELGIGPERGLRVRITGYPALNDEEMRGLVMDVGIAGLFSFAMVLVVLGWAFRSLSMVAASGITLIVGLVLTAAFAAFAVGSLNVVSIAFAVLFIGLGVDFAIHLGLHVLVEQRRRGHRPRGGVRAGRGATWALPCCLCCDLTTADRLLRLRTHGLQGGGGAGADLGLRHVRDPRASR